MKTLTIRTDYNEVCAEILCQDIGFYDIHSLINDFMMDKEKLYQHREKLL